MTHVEGDVDPVRDLEIISEELRLKDLQYLTNKIVRKERRVLWTSVSPLVSSFFLLSPLVLSLSIPPSHSSLSLSLPFSLLFLFHFTILPPPSSRLSLDLRKWSFEAETKSSNRNM